MGFEEEALSAAPAREQSGRWRAAPTRAAGLAAPPGGRTAPGLLGREVSGCAVSAVPFVSREQEMPNVMKKTNIQSEGRQPFNPDGGGLAYVSPFNTARQFCSSCRLPFACFSSNSASSTKFFLNAATLLVLKSISSCFADSDIFSNF